eukprot:UN06988
MISITSTNPASTVSSKASSGTNPKKSVPSPITPSRPALTKKPSLKGDVSLSISLVDHDHEKTKKKITPATYTGSGTETKKITKVHINKTDCFLAITTRNAILMLTISFSVVLVSFCFYGFRFIFGPQTRLTLLVPMNMAAFDGLITSVCVFCLFSAGNKLYHVLCDRCDKKFKRICLKVAQKTLIS